MKNYGKELIIDLHDCNTAMFTRGNIRTYFKEICSLIEMERCELFWWDDLHTPKAEKETEPHLVGTSAIQFIKTSNITIHTLDILKAVYLNIFSCKEFNSDLALSATKTYFQGIIVSSHIIDRV